jgi:hypothetical protein
MKNAAGDGPGLAEPDATRELPAIRRRKLGSIRYANSGVGPPARTVSRNDVTDGDDATRALPVVRPARIRLMERVGRAGSIRLTERIRLAGRGFPPEIAHE